MNELDFRMKRDADPYRGVASGRWKDALWLPYVRAVLNSDSWVRHRQVWSLREEMFITWAHETRLRLVAERQVRLPACHTKKSACKRHVGVKPIL